MSESVSVYLTVVFDGYYSVKQYVCYFWVMICTLQNMCTYYMPFNSYTNYYLRGATKDDIFEEEAQVMNPEVGGEEVTRNVLAGIILCRMRLQCQLRCNRQ